MVGNPFGIVMKLTFVLTFASALALLVPGQSIAGALDDAPFRLVVPSGEWQIDDSRSQPMGKDVFLVATISKTNALLRSVVIKAGLTNASASSFEEFCAGIRDTFANPAVEKISETNTLFLGFKAKRFIYQVTQGAQTTYNETTVFLANDKGWGIACVGPLDQKGEIKKILGFYRKKAG